MIEFSFAGINVSLGLYFLWVRGRIFNQRINVLLP